MGMVWGHDKYVTQTHGTHVGQRSTWYEPHNLDYSIPLRLLWSLYAQLFEYSKDPFRR